MCMRAIHSQTSHHKVSGFLAELDGASQWFQGGTKEMKVAGLMCGKYP